MFLDVVRIYWILLVSLFRSDTSRTGTIKPDGMKSLGTSNIRSSLLVGLLVAWVISAPNIPTCCEEFRGGLMPSYDQLAIVDNSYNNWHRQRQTHTDTQNRLTECIREFDCPSIHPYVEFTCQLDSNSITMDYGLPLPNLPFLLGWIAGVVVYVCVCL